eukprot:3668817-Karenia_brevis.AAC.1
MAPGTALAKLWRPIPYPELYGLQDGSSCSSRQKNCTQPCPSFSLPLYSLVKFGYHPFKF